MAAFGALRQFPLQAACCSRAPCPVVHTSTSGRPAERQSACLMQGSGWAAPSRPSAGSLLAGARSCWPHSTCVAAAATAEGSATSTLDADSSQESRDFAVAIAEVCDSVKVQDLVVLHVEPLVSWTSYMVICTVVSRPQLLAVLGRVEKAAEEEHGRTKQNVPGSSPWEVVDYGDVVLHVFTAEQREFYDIESFYAAAEEVDLPFAMEQPGSASSEQAGLGGQWSVQI